MELIYRDHALLVVNKPSGLLAVPGRGEDKQDCLSSRMQQQFPDALIVHRLDMATSGLLVFARGAEMQRLLSRMFREHAVAKRYVAVVTGKLVPAIGEINLPLIADWPNRPKQKVDHASGKASLTRYRVLAHTSVTSNPSTPLRAVYPEQCRRAQGERKSVITRVELEPVTGRTHQLRVHLAAIGHPILGDALYVGRAAARLMLHACSLGFIHPLSGEPLSIVCDPPF